MKKVEIAQLINNYYNPPPDKRAALILWSKGVTETQVLSAPNVSEPRRVAVANALRDIEKTAGKYQQP